MLAALGASVAIVVAETAGATLTVSASLIAEAAHLWVDAANSPCCGSLTAISRKDDRRRH